VTVFEWDREKAEANNRKHGIDFSTEAVSVFDDAGLMLMRDDESDPTEQRFIALGMGMRARILVVVHVYRTRDRIRIISARRATRHEEQEYQGQ